MCSYTVMSLYEWVSVLTFFFISTKCKELLGLMGGIWSNLTVMLLEVTGLQRSVGFVFQGPWLSVQNFTAIHQEVAAAAGRVRNMWYNTRLVLKDCTYCIVFVCTAEAVGTISTMYMFFSWLLLLYNPWYLDSESGFAHQRYTVNLMVVTELLWCINHHKLSTIIVHKT